MASIGSSIDDDDLVAFTVNGLREDEKWKPFITSVYVRESVPKSDDLMSLMIIEELNLVGSSSQSNHSQAFYAGSR